MTNDLYTEFTKAITSLPENDLAGALDAAETVVRIANRHHGRDELFPRHPVTGRPVDRLLGVFDGRSVREVVEVMGRLRGEVAEELAQRGAAPEVVREMREGG